MNSNIEIINYARFRNLIVTTAPLERLHDGMRWAEGPVYFADTNTLIFSDLPNDRLMAWTGSGVSVLRSPSNVANGNARDREGRLITCESGARRLTRTEHDGRVFVLVDSFEGRKLNSPNDVVVSADGIIWFTDPDYGLLSNYTGRRGERELNANNVFRFDALNSTLTVATNTMVKPNGLAFSPDESVLYVADSGRTHDPEGPHHIIAFDVKSGILSNRRPFATVDPGIPDGICVDEDGRVWSSAADGVHCFDIDGELIGKIRLPETVSNVAFGGPNRDRLFITTATSLYAIYLSVGAP